MKTDIKEIAENTVNNLITEIRSAPEQLNKEEILLTIEEHIKSAFNRVNEEEKPFLFKQLSLKLHPDKLKFSHPEFYEHLEQLELANEPQKIVNQTYKPDILEELRTSKNFWEGMYTLNPLHTTMERYSPFPRFIAKAIYYTALILGMITFAITIVMPAIAIIIVYEVIGKNVSKLFNWAVDNHYKSSFLNALKKEYIEKRKKELILDPKAPFNPEELEAMSDDTLYAALLKIDYPSFFPTATEERSAFESEEERKLYQKIRKEHWDYMLNKAHEYHERIMEKTIKLSYFNRLKLPFIAYYTSFSKNSDWITTQLLKKSLALLGLFIITVTLPISYLANNIILAGVIATLYSVAGFAISLMAVLNIPMYLWEATNSLTNLCKSCFNKEYSVPLSGQTQGSHSCIRKRLTLECVIQQNDKEPSHMSSPIASRSPEKNTENKNGSSPTQIGSVPPECFNFL